MEKSGIKQQWSVVKVTLFSETLHYQNATKVITGIAYNASFAVAHIRQILINVTRTWRNFVTQ
jgi:hypothetical protein